MKDKKVIVAGTGKSGISAAGLLVRNGAEVTLFDEKTSVDRDKIMSEFYNSEKISLVLGELTDEILSDADLMVISPGIPVDAPFVEKVREKDIPIWGEIELAYYFNKGKIAAITGTNGKTTTTTLVGEIFKEYTDNSIVVGNIGIPFTKLCDTTTEETLVAAEISSFQLETIHEFRPHISAILNLTPDHLNRHYTFDNYAEVKFKITKNQTEDDICILNYDDEDIRKRRLLAERVHVVYFSRKEMLSEGVCVADGDVCVFENGRKTRLLSLKDIKLLGDHNIENVLAAAAITYYMGIPAEIIEKVCTEFKGVEHRIEYVATINGVPYYNDSKGTNPDAAIRGIRAMTRTTFLIGGGYDKKASYDEWIEAFDWKVKYLVLIGETAEAIAKCAKSHGFNNIVIMDSLKDAVMFCYENAKPQDAVLLSPACASWGMFDNYEQRGDLFKQYVRELEE